LNENRQKINENLIRISVLVPSNWHKKKRICGFSWRQIMARGFNAIETREQLNSVLHDYMDKIERLNNQNTNLRGRLMLMEEKMLKQEKAAQEKEGLLKWR